MRKSIGLLFFFLMSLMSFAQAIPNGSDFNTITVTGHASVLASPDKIVLHVTLSDEYCAGPKENIDALTATYNNALTSLGVDKSKSKLLKEDRFDLGYTTARKTSEMISRKYQLELSSTTQYDKFKTMMISKGVEIEVIEIANSGLATAKQKAQREAIIAAKEKASNYVEVAGGKLGRVLRIDENNEVVHPSASTAGDELAEGVAFPLISNDFIEYDVIVVFELQ